jgi:hypothetical protein
VLYLQRFVAIAGVPALRDRWFFGAEVPLILLPCKAETVVRRIGQHNEAFFPTRSCFARVGVSAQPGGAALRYVGVTFARTNAKFAGGAAAFLSRTSCSCR